MEYSFIKDPVLRNKLEKANKKNFEKLENNRDNLYTNEEKISVKDLQKKTSKPNKKFESLKATKRKNKKKNLNDHQLKLLQYQLNS